MEQMDRFKKQLLLPEMTTSLLCTMQGLFNVKDKLGRGALLVALMAKAGQAAVQQLITVRRGSMRMRT